MKIAVYVGTVPETEVPYILLKESIRRFNNNIAVTECDQFNVKSGIDATPFSYNRVLIPLYEDFDNYDFVFYLDSDQIVIRDLTQQLKELNLSGNGFYSVNYDFDYFQSSVLLWDVRKFNKQNYVNKLSSINITSYSVDEVTKILGVSECLGQEWNMLDWVDKNSIITHFTYMPTQPWINCNSILYKFYLKESVNVFLSMSQPDKESFLSKLNSASVTGAINYVFARDLVKHLGCIDIKIKKPLIFIPYWLIYNRRVPFNKLLFKMYFEFNKLYAKISKVL